MTEISSEIAAQRPAGALAIRPSQTDWTPQQLSALQALGIDSSVSGGDLQVFLTYAQRTGLDPFARQIYLIKRGGRWSIQTGIDGFRVIAQRSGKYRGQTPAEWCGADGAWTDVWLKDSHPAAARAGVLHADYPEPLYAVATWRQYVATDSKGKPTGQWPRMGALMLHKCAEALALRRAFPNDLSGVYIAEEMDQSGPGQRPAPVAPRTLSELVGDANDAKTLATLQAIWREAAASGLLDEPVTIDRDSGEITATFRDRLLALAHNLDPSPGGASSQTTPPGEAAPSTDQPETVDNPDETGDGDVRSDDD